MRVAARAAVTVGAAALVVGTGAGIAAADALPTPVTARVFLNDQPDKVSAAQGATLKVSPVLSGTIGDSGGKSFVVTFDPNVLNYVGGSKVAGTTGDCTISGDTVNCPVDVRELSKRLDLDFVVRKDAGVGLSTVRFTGTNGADKSADAAGDLTVTKAPPSTTTPPPPTGVYYKNCDAARAAGAAPINKGQPGYRPALDRDNDGVACEDDSSSSTPQQVSQVPAGAPDTGGGSTATDGSTAPGFPVWLEIALGGAAVAGTGLMVRVLRRPRRQ